MGRNFVVGAKIKGKDEASPAFRRVGRTITRSLLHPISSVRSAVGKLHSALLAVPGVANIMSGLRRAGESVLEVTQLNDRLAKTARLAGVTSQTLQEMRHAAGLAGMETEQLDAGLKKFGIAMGQFRRGGGPMAEVLKKTWTPAARKALLATTSNEEALNLYLEAMSKVPDAGRRADMAVGAFGESGSAMAEVVSGGMDALNKARADFRAFGYVVDDKGTASAEAFNDQVSRVKTSWEGLKTAFGTGVIEGAMPALNELVDWLKANKGSLFEDARKFGRDFASSVADIARNIPGIVSGVASVATDIARVVGSLKDGAPILGGLLAARWFGGMGGGAAASGAAGGGAAAAGAGGALAGLASPAAIMVATQAVGPEDVDAGVASMRAQIAREQDAIVARGRFFRDYAGQRGPLPPSYFRELYGASYNEVRGLSSKAAQAEAAAALMPLVRELVGVAQSKVLVQFAGMPAGARVKTEGKVEVKANVGRVETAP